MKPLPRHRSVTFRYRLTGAGWSAAHISDGINAADLSASYLDDALGDLTAAVVLLMQGADEQTVSWAEEPGEYRWNLERRDQRLYITIRWFDELWGHQPDAAGKVVFAAQCPLEEFAAEMRDELAQILSTYGLAGYKENWIEHDFPLDEYEKLKELIHER